MRILKLHSLGAALTEIPLCLLPVKSTGALPGQGHRREALAWNTPRWGLSVFLGQGPPEKTVENPGPPE